jgi:hypothetical protein
MEDKVGIRWRKSSYSGNGGGNCVEVAATLSWHKSSHSGNGGADCIEVARRLPDRIVVRDSKDPDGPVLTVTPTDWQAFTRAIKARRHDLT